ncbi:NAD(P)/FAD-dependent oxidoreductase [Acidihalobacter yilgarnensis]|uniref:NAD(P)/FAD-dependent oxidoreductase n=1 Tax=Acidihalobacter yilgarnensis TaxID=2819280 RepID=UPI0009F36DF0|nr:NAD(P)/FAD-dependent oxidoreductase [Acidihalobacter yilgarnensis]
MNSNRTALPSETENTPQNVGGCPRVVVVGAGFGGLAAARGLRSTGIALTVIDRRNFHLFQPLLYQVATAGLNPADIAWPVRSILRNQRNATVLLGEVVEVDASSSVVRLQDNREIPFDWLILATGATHNYFGHDEWERIAPSLKTVEDATLIRRRVLEAFERAENRLTTDHDDDKTRQLMTFVIIGGGPTGVELAGAIAELAKKALTADFRNIDPRSARILLIEGSPSVLGQFSPSLSAFARRSLEKMGVEVQVDTHVTHCTEDCVTCGDLHIPAANIFWAAGVKASPAARWLNIAADPSGRVKVKDDFSVDGHPNIFVIGDSAAYVQDGKPIPGIAPAAKQAGAYVATHIASDVAGKALPKPFRFRNYGSLATIGRNAAVMDLGPLRLKGRLAWWLWGITHIFFLIGNRNRLLVAMQWFYNYLTFGRGARLIVGPDRPSARH